MAYQMTFKRYELKYLLNRQEKEQVLLAMQPYMKLDDYGRTIIRNIYFDTDTFRLIRRSLEKPVYKEKLRIRSYKPVQTSDPVFVEIKKNTNLWFTSGDCSFRKRKLWKVFRQELPFQYIPKSEMKFSIFVITMKTCTRPYFYLMKGKPIIPWMAVTFG